MAEVFVQQGTNVNFGKVPSYWTDYPQESVKTKKEGEGTCFLITLPV
jgi:hypothetical protein